MICFEEIRCHCHHQAHLIHHFVQGQMPLSTHKVQCRIWVRPGYFINRMRRTSLEQNMTSMTQPGFNPAYYKPFGINSILVQGRKYATQSLASYKREKAFCGHIHKIGNTLVYGHYRFYTVLVLALHVLVELQYNCQRHLDSSL